MAGLKTYRAKRDFTKTEEPRGKARSQKGHRYVIQKHDASRLHYDLRLEHDGVMKSWAVTRGPSLVPGEKRLAVHVEDHPVEYNTFEGTIPKGQYGGGTVMVWDQGSWYPEGDVEKALKKGHLDFRIDGDKLGGRWHLVRMRKRSGERQDPWLLIKSEDEFARHGRDPDILEEKPLSVVSGRSIPEIAAAGDRVWHSNRGAGDQPEARPKRAAKAAVKPKVAAPRGAARTGKKARETGVKKKPTRKKAKKEKDWAGVLATVAGARKRPLPDFIPPCLATLSDNAPDSDAYLHEIKFDGYRMQGRLASAATLKTRTGLDWTHRFPSIADAMAHILVGDVIIDGEIVSMGESGASDFSALQEDLKNGRHDRMFYYVFDLLHLDGFDLMGAALSERKQILSQLLSDIPEGVPITLSEDFRTPGPVLLDHACRFHLEGIISKRADAPYRSGRTGDWLKIKCASNQEFVIAGYEPSETKTRSIRALLLGYYDDDEFRYAGRVGTGFKVSAEQDLLRKLDDLKSSKPTFETIPAEERRRKVRWVLPKLVAEIDFRGWTHGEVLRQASFKGLREDKAAREVVREVEMRTASRKITKEAKSEKAPAKKTIVHRKDDAVVAGITLSHPDRIYWADVGVTKQMLAEYYAQVWDRMAPHLVDRPIALLRCPGGTAAKCFFQKHASGGIESDLLRLIPQKGEEDIIAVEDLAGLISLAQAGVLEIHTWGTVADRIETCERLVFDLDPGPGLDFDDVKDGARDVKKRLEALGLETFLKTTGGKGLHVVVPIAPTDWDVAKGFAHDIALKMERDDPRRYVSTMAKKLRDKRIFVDYLRNGRGATAIAPYSTRARAGATVSTPISWAELASMKAPNAFSVLNLERRLKKLKRDPWAGIGKVKQKLPKT
jgi:bifunctional non-homologous end joining protein LigD